MKKILIASSIIALLASGALIVSAKQCDGIKLKYDKETDQCLSKDQYKELKKELKDNYDNKDKGYDFEIEYMDDLQAVFDYEAGQGNLQLEGISNNEELQSALIDLLQ